MAKEQYGPGSGRMILMDLECGLRVAVPRPDETYGTDNITAWKLARAYAKDGIMCLRHGKIEPWAKYIGSTVKSRAAKDADKVLT